MKGLSASIGRDVEHAEFRGALVSGIQELHRTADGLEAGGDMAGAARAQLQAYGAYRVAARIGGGVCVHIQA